MASELLYDPDVGRFINQDSYLGNNSTPPSLHRYLYAYSNPTLYVDANGNFPITEQIASFLNKQSSDSFDALKSMQAQHGSTVATRSGAAITGIGGTLLGAAGGIVSLVDMALDAEASQVGKAVGLGDTQIVKDSTQKTAERMASLKAFAGNAKNYASQEDLAGVVARDGIALGNKAAEYGNDVFVKGDLDKVGSFSGALFEAATGGMLKAAKVAKAKPKPSATTEKPNLNDGNSQKTTDTGNSAGCPCCFAGGTPVLTKDGLKAIELVVKGELVAARNEETGEVDWKPITALFINDDDRLTYSLVLVNELGVEEAYEVTDNHPFYVSNVGWVESIELESGMEIPSYSGSFLTVVSLIALYQSPITYNFEVDEYHTYFVGEQGAWVHNKCKCDGKKVYRRLSAQDRMNLDQGKPLQPKADGGSIPDHVKGKDTQHISVSDSKEATKRFDSGNGLVEIDVKKAEQKGAKHIDRKNVEQAVKRDGDKTALRDAKRAEESLFRGAIPNDAVKIIEEGK